MIGLQNEYSELDVEIISNWHKFLLESILWIIKMQRIDDNRKNWDIFFRKLVNDWKLENDTLLPFIFSLKHMFFENNREWLLEVKSKLEKLSILEWIDLIKFNSICEGDIYAERLYSFFVPWNINDIKKTVVSDIHAITVWDWNRHMGKRPSYWVSRGV